MTSTLGNYSCHRSGIIIVADHAGMLPTEFSPTKDFIQGCHIEPVSLEIAQNAGIFRFKQRQKGITLSIVDCIIAETARSNQHLVATHNKKHYPESAFWDL